MTGDSPAEVAKSVGRSGHVGNDFRSIDGFLDFTSSKGLASTSAPYQAIFAEKEGGSSIICRPQLFEENISGFND